MCPCSCSSAHPPVYVYLDLGKVQYFLQYRQKKDIRHLSVRIWIPLTNPIMPGQVLILVVSAARDVTKARNCREDSTAEAGPGPRRARRDHAAITTPELPPLVGYSAAIIV